MIYFGYEIFPRQLRRCVVYVELAKSIYHVFMHRTVFVLWFRNTWPAKDLSIVIWQLAMFYLARTEQ